METTVKKTVRDMAFNKVVYNILKENISAQNDDSVLYLEVLKAYGCSPNMRATTLENRIKEGTLPSRNTVARYRRQYKAMV